MTTAAANEYRYNLGPDYSLADFNDPEYLDTDGEPEEDERAARQALNAEMACWYSIG